MLKLTRDEIRDWSNVLSVRHIGAARDKEVADHAAEHAVREICQFVKDWDSIDLDQFEAKYGISVHNDYWAVIPLPELLDKWLRSQGVEV